MIIEKRMLGASLDFRDAGSDKRTIGGYAAVFDVETEIGGYFREKISKGAFAGAMEADVRALIDHDTGRVIGRSTSGTLRMKEDEKGLQVEIDLPATSDGNDLAELLTRGDVSGMSFGFEVTKQTWDETDPDNPLRTVEEVNLFEVSVVAFPAYPDASVAMRSLEIARKEQKRQNFNAAAKRLRMKANLDARERGIKSTA